MSADESMCMMVRENEDIQMQQLGICNFAEVGYDDDDDADDMLKLC